MPDKIIIGKEAGVFINDVFLGLTRGGSTFERVLETREINADGDYGPVKGRIRKTRAVPQIATNLLELDPDEIPQFYAFTEIDTSDPGHDVITAKTILEESDYIDKVAIVGKSHDGRDVMVEIYNAVNLENLNWPFLDNDDVVAACTFQGTYLESARDVEPWSIKYAKGETYSVTFTVEDGTATAVSGAAVTFNGMTTDTNGSGVAVFTGVEVGANKSLKVVAGGFEIYNAAINVVDEDVAQTITLTAI